MPPMLAFAPGSIGKNSPWSRRYSFSCSRRTPASTTQSKSPLLTATILVIRLRPSDTPPCTASVLPSTEVPAPYAMTGTPASRQRFTASTTSSVDSAKITASGGMGAKWVSLRPCSSRIASPCWKRSPNRSPNAVASSAGSPPPEPWLAVPIVLELEPGPDAYAPLVADDAHIAVGQAGQNQRRPLNVGFEIALVEQVVDERRDFQPADFIGD